ncbi:sentrin-specific protease 2 isoform X2 [Antechinus flavipes]|uniref:sentrin-specific protease 2 isoform X2 n=1 Tax=Antechinus flavipes TaxID=38775 RepID=UPI00223659E9|nr:sentrin-specific protease 2 isoform X2 [Antechinus flavipes]
MTGAHVVGTRFRLALRWCQKPATLPWWGSWRLRLRLRRGQRLPGLQPERRRRRRRQRQQEQELGLRGQQQRRRLWQWHRRFRLGLLLRFRPPASGLCWPPRFPRRPVMYRWLLSVLHSVFRRPRGRPELAARPLLKRRLSDRTPATDEIQAKRPRLDYLFHRVKKSVWDITNLFGTPVHLSPRCPEASGCNGAHTGSSPREVLPKRSSPKLTKSGPSRDVLTSGNKTRNGASKHSNKVSRDHRRHVMPSFSFPRNQEVSNKRMSGRHSAKSPPDSSVARKQPAQDRKSSESRSAETGRATRRPRCTVEEGFQREEREKYQRLLQRLKEGCHGNCLTPVTANHHGSHRCHVEGVRNGGWGEDQHLGMRAGQLVPKQYRVTESWGPVRVMRNEKRHFKAKTEEKKSEQKLENESDMEKEVNSALGCGPQDEILSSAFKLRITRGDIQTLKNYHWLNDEIINFYMNLLVERNKKQGLPRLHAFSTFFYPKLNAGGYQSVRRWTKGVDLFEQDIILVPIHRRVHWSLVVIDVRKKAVRYLDSMGQKSHRICNLMLQYLQEESKAKRNRELIPAEWSLESAKPYEIPQQTNGSDCGMFTCKYADYLSQDKPITFTQNQMPHFRKRMVWEILHQQLL